MAKEKNEPISQNVTPIKPMDEMSDSEFITYADYLSSPYYRAYISAKCRNEDAAAPTAATATAVAPVPQTEAPAEKESATKSSKKDGKSKKAPALYVKKRTGALVVIFVIMLLLIAVNVVGYLNIENVSGYVDIYNIVDGKESISVSALDPAVAIVRALVKNEAIESVYFNYFIDGNLENADFLTKVSLFAVPVASVVIVLFAVIGLIKAIVAMCSKRKENGCFAKYNFGFLSVAMFLCGAITFFGGLYVAGIKLSDALEFITFKSTVMNAGYGLYAIIVLPIISWIMTCIAYKKQK